MFTWSLGCTGLYSPFLPPSATFARLAMTSLVFMLWEVPEPAWNRSTTNSSWYWPAIIASAASTIDMARRGSSAPADSLTATAARLMRTWAIMKSVSGRRPETGKFSTARAVCMPYQASDGTGYSPSVAFFVGDFFVLVGLHLVLGFLYYVA